VTQPLPMLPVLREKEISRRRDFGVEARCGFPQGLKRLCRNPYWFAAVEGITQNSAPNGAKELSPARTGVPKPRRFCVDWGG